MKAKGKAKRECTPTHNSFTQESSFSKLHEYHPWIVFGVRAKEKKKDGVEGKKKKEEEGDK